MRSIRSSLAVVVAAVAVLSVAAPVSAFQIVSETGSVGPYTLDDSAFDPADAGAKCTSVTRGDGWDYFRWMRVRPPSVFSPDQNSQTHDRRTVGWRFKLQRQITPADPWTTLLTSNEERATSFDNTQAPLHAKRLSWQSYYPDARYRALVIVNWYRHGELDGRARVLVQYYHTVAPQANPSNVTEWSCPNRSD